MLGLFKLKFYKTEETLTGKWALVFFGMLVLSLFLGGIAMVPIKADPLLAYFSLIKGAIGSRFALSETILRALPLLFIGLGTTLCFRAGLWNIGGNGQIFAGGMAATAVSMYLGNLPPLFLIPLTILAGALAGGIWSGIAGLLRAKLNINEVFVTVMMNYIMLYFSIFIVEEVWREPTYGMAWSEIIPETSWWPMLIPETKIHLGLAIAVIASVITYYLLFRTPFGYEIQATGLNHRAAFCKFKRIKTQRMIILVMVIAGLWGGIAGAGQVCGDQHRFSLQICANYGFLGIIVALLGGLNPIGVIIASFFLSSIMSGAINMQVITGVPISLIDFVIGLLLLSAISAPMVSRYKICKRHKNE